MPSTPVNIKLEVLTIFQGLRITDFIAAAQKFNEAQRKKAVGVLGRDRSYEEPPRGEDEVSDERDMDLARSVWEWTVARDEVLVGAGRAWNGLSLDEILALPEEEITTVDEVATASPPIPIQKPEKTKIKADPPESRPTTRPRLFVNEQTLWLTITGHEIDLKRIPRLEFACLGMCQFFLSFSGPRRLLTPGTLVGIASFRTEGILQADLRVLVGQDKRSVPKRTDFLAMKGYIAKRTTVTRGFKTSRLWLKGFAPAELPTADSPTTSALKVDLSPEALRRDLEPVAWRHRWLGDTVEYKTFGQTFLAIIQAFGVMRLVTLKTKLGIAGRKWQMKVYILRLVPPSRDTFAYCHQTLAAQVGSTKKIPSPSQNKALWPGLIPSFQQILSKECRRFASFGVLKYVAATMHK